MKAGDLVKIFGASKQPHGVIVRLDDRFPNAVFVLQNNDLHWIVKSKLEVISESR